MKPLFFSAAIIISIIIVLQVTYKITGSYKKAKRNSFLTMIGWVIWNIFMLTFLSPLWIWQMILGIIVFFTGNKILKEKLITNKLIKQLKNDINRIDNKRLKKLLNRIKSDLIKPIIGPQNHRKQLIQTLKESQKSIIILSGWATDYSINEEFRVLVQQALGRGVNIYIGYGYQSSVEQKIKKDTEKNAINTLKNLQDWSANVESNGRLYVRYYKNHSKILICDYKYAINGSFNWLSNIGHSHNDERSWIVYDNDFVKKETEQIISDFENPKNPTNRRGFLNRFYQWTDYP